MDTGTVPRLTAVLSSIAAAAQVVSPCSMEDKLLELSNISLIVKLTVVSGGYKICRRKPIMLMTMKCRWAIASGS